MVLDRIKKVNDIKQLNEEEELHKKVLRIATVY